MVPGVRLAIVSDIHGNLMALDAVMTDLEQQAVDEVWCGGDLGWGGPWASECIARVRAQGWRTVRGNTDVWITGDPQTITGDEKRKHAAAMAEQHAISPEDARWLLDLPLGVTGTGSLLLVHGTPASPFVAPLPDAPAGEFAPYLDQASTVVYGHVHRAFTRRLADGTLVVNSGAVGLPLDGETSCYLLVDSTGPELTLTHRRVAFDRRAGLAQAKTMGGPVGAFFTEMMGKAR
jgi:predicted phosphodiesterase